MKRIPLVALLLAISACASLTAQTFSLNNNPLRLVSLDGLWRFQAGDDSDGKKGWAAPGFDDSSWALVRSDKSWPEQALPVVGGSFWYRTKLLVPAGSGPLSLYMPALTINYQVFADGKLVGTMGSMPPHPSLAQEVVGVFPVSGPSPQAHVVTLAIRAWQLPARTWFYTSGLEHGVLVGDARLIQQLSLLNTRNLFWRSTSRIFLTFLEILAAIAALVLFSVRSREKEYLWFGVAMLGSAIDDSITIYRVFHISSLAPFNLFQSILGYAVLFAFIGFYRRLMNAGRDWFYWCTIACLTAKALFDLGDYVQWAFSYWLPFFFGFPTDLLLQVPFYCWILNLLIRKTMQGRVDALLLLLSNAPGLLGLYADFATFIAKPKLGWNVGTLTWYYYTTKWPFPASLHHFGSFLLMLTMFGILVYRFTRTSLEEEEHKHELEAARIVQQVLIPDAIPVVRGLTIQSVYKPAGQVGGDFFQIVPIRDSGVVVVIGDVSGKGMPAALTVSLLVGTVRTLARYTQSPGEILAAMNHRMMGRSNGGFTTCLVARLESGGLLTLANAGHLAPYRNGEELPIDNGLPLGIALEATYAESVIQISSGDRLTFLSDGVVEAQSPTGELFGFDRTAAISTQSAEAIALAAQQFGQEDDITVLTVARAPKLEAVTA
jgi:hypothetical protein